MVNKKKIHIGDYRSLAIETLVTLKMQAWKTEQALKQIKKSIYKEYKK